MSSTSSRDTRVRPGEAVAGLLAAIALFLGALELIYKPFRLAPAALILLLTATLMSREQQRLIALATAIVGICFVVGAGIQVYLNHSLY